MERSFMKKTMNIFFCALLGAAVLIGGCSDNTVSYTHLTLPTN